MLEEIRKTVNELERNDMHMVPYKDHVTYLLSLIDQYKEALKQYAEGDMVYCGNCDSISYNSEQCEVAKKALGKE